MGLKFIEMLGKKLQRMSLCNFLKIMSFREDLKGGSKKKELEIFKKIIKNRTGFSLYFLIKRKSKAVTKNKK